MKKAKRTTLRDVAVHAGVSTGTVSLVLNGSKLVAGATRERVMQAISDLGYVYDRGAAQLRSRRTKIVGLSICNLMNPYFAEVAAGIENILNELGYVVLMGNCGESVAKQRRFLENIRGYNVDGILMMPARETSAQDVTEFLSWGMPIVMVSRYVRGIELDYAGPDNRNGTAAATRHLLDLGHRTIGYIGSNRKTTSGQDRAAGFRLQMRRAGLKVDPALVVECGDSREDGFNAIQTLFRLPTPPTGVVCFNDVIAFGTMLGLRDMGLVPGRDCSVVGHDDVAEAALWRPQLTTVVVDAEGVGVAAGTLLRARMEGSRAAPRRQVLKTTLVVRETCAPPRQVPKRRTARKLDAESA